MTAIAALTQVRATQAGPIRQAAQLMADAIVALCAGPATSWQHMSQRSHDRAHGYSWQDATTRLLDVLSQEATGGAAAEQPRADRAVRTIREPAPGVSAARV